MAEIKLQGVANTVTAGGNTLTATSDASGVAVVELNIREKDYNAISTVLSRGAKSGYNDGLAQLTSLPNFAVAVANGISLRVRMTERTAAQISVSPSSITFPATGGTQTVTVTAPDSSWVISSTGVAATRNGNVITLTCPAGSGQTFAPLIIGYQSADGWLYATCELSRAASGVETGTISLSGTVYSYDSGTGTRAPLANAAVAVKVSYGGGSLVEVATGTSNASGAWGATWETDAETWATISQITIEASATGYTTNTTNQYAIPAFDDAVADGVAFQIIQLTKVAEVGFRLNPTSASVPATGGTVVIQVLGTNGSWVHEANYDGGEIRVQATITENRTNNTLTVTLPQIPSNWSGLSGAVVVSYQGVYKQCNITQPALS